MCSCLNTLGPTKEALPELSSAYVASHAANYPLTDQQGARRRRQPSCFAADNAPNRRAGPTRQRGDRALLGLAASSRCGDTPQWSSAPASLTNHSAEVAVVNVDVVMLPRSLSWRRRETLLVEEVGAVESRAARNVFLDVSRGKPL